MATFMYTYKKSYVLDFSCGLSSPNGRDFIGMIYLVFNDTTLFKSLLTLLQFKYSWILISLQGRIYFLIF